jgi:hypothetical protein
VDELVAVGTAGLLGLVLTVLLLIGAIIWISGMVWSALSSGDWQGVGRIAAVLLGIAVVYTGIGVLLQKSGHI